METKHYVIIKVLDVNGNWYDNAFIENDNKVRLAKKRYWSFSNTFFIVLNLVV